MEEEEEKEDTERMHLPEGSLEKITQSEWLWQIERVFLSLYSNPCVYIRTYVVYANKAQTHAHAYTVTMNYYYYTKVTPHQVPVLLKISSAVLMRWDVRFLIGIVLITTSIYWLAATSG